MHFDVFGKAVAKKFKEMQKQTLYRINTDKAIWDYYLASFPEGSNPIYRTRTEHDCQCCKRFVRDVGNVVTIDSNGDLTSVWDISIGGDTYQVVADRMSAYVKANYVSNLFLTFETTAGVEKSIDLNLNSQVITWKHFFVNIPEQFRIAKKDLDTRLGVVRSSKDVLLRSLTELTLDSVESVLEVIGSIYRGNDHKFVLETFFKLKKEFDKLKQDFPAESDVYRQNNFAWSKVSNTPESVLRIRNTSIGTLLQDLSEGMDIDVAIGKFEAIMAPSNYKRPTALVTKKQIEQAQKTIEELGYGSALFRRHAISSDLHINDIIFADNDVKKAMDVFDILASSIPEKAKNFDRVEEITIDKFLKDIVPNASSIELMVENKHENNFFTLVAPEDPTALQMFKHSNNFSWSYNGAVADSIKERVKKAGGKVEGDLCCRLAWEYTDDLDFHMKEPSGHKIYFRNRKQKSPDGGMLDVDANGMDGRMEHPVENIYYGNKSKMNEGVYTLSVNNYSRRSEGVGFEVEIEFGGSISTFVYDKVLRSSEYVEVAQIKYSKLDGFKIIKSLPSTQTSKTLWNVPTHTFQKVKVVMLSPNFWGDQQIGNKHYFFVIENCLSEGKVRGFYNELLKPTLEVHRKVFEMVAGKMEVKESTDQLSGLGFSSTQRNSFLVKVTGKVTRTLKVVV